jgi:hypothetical protein
MLHMSRRRIPPLPAALVALALVGFVVALFGTYWDDAWHTEEGRDSFLAPPHVALYAGISLTGIAIALWTALAARTAGFRAVRSHPPLVLALLGVAVALGAAPADNAWHLAFGRDAVVWSPPHMLGIAGNLAIAAGLYLELSSARSALGRYAAVVAGAAVLAVGAAPVLEYDTDVPQFDLAFYVPVLAAGSAFALGLVAVRSTRRWAASEVALVYTAIMASISGLLALGGMPGPIVPLLVVPAVGLDLTRRRSASPVAAGLGFALCLYVAYVPYLNEVLSGPFLERSDITTGLPLAIVAAIIGIWLTSLGRPRSEPPIRLAAAATLALIVLALPGSAGAHDPGQGTEVTTADLVGRTSGSSEAVLSVRPAACGEIAPTRLVARRGGTEVGGELRSAGACRLAGSVVLPERGRWFVYAELTYRGEEVETWLPLISGETEVVREEDRSVYRPPVVDDPPAKSVAGVVVYLVLAGVVLAIPLIARRHPVAGPAMGTG